MEHGKSRRRRSTYRRTAPDPAHVLILLVAGAIALGEVAYAYVLIVWGAA